MYQMLCCSIFFFRALTCTLLLFLLERDIRPSVVFCLAIILQRDGHTETIASRGKY